MFNSSFFRPYSVARGTFSTGFIFKYLDLGWTRHFDDKMTVKPVHQTLKDEVLGSGYLSRAQWANIVEVKAREYMKTTRVRKMKGVTKEHIYAIILYCDFTALCTAFSATFRRQHVFELMESVKQRHSHFAIFGRYLVELVLRFGIKGFSLLDDEYENGPFFCGLNGTFNVGSFAITLKGPCSTSTVRTVALNFATKQGVILEFENDTDDAMLQNFFDCSWISNYSEESERLWIAGSWPLRIVSIVIVRTAKDYRNMLRALFLFDAMISGVVLLKDFQMKPEAADCELLQKLIESELSGGNGAVTEFDEYLKKEWNIFLQSKTEIVLKWQNISEDFDVLSKLVVFGLVKYKKDEAPKGNVNVLKSQWISIFPVVHTVTIDAAVAYKFRLEALLDSMELLPRSVCTVIVKDWGRWAKDALNNDVGPLLSGSRWSAEYKEEKQIVFTLKNE